MAWANNVAGKPKHTTNSSMGQHSTDMRIFFFLEKEDDPRPLHLDDAWVNTALTCASGVAMITTVPRSSTPRAAGSWTMSFALSPSSAHLHLHTYIYIHTQH